MTPPRPSSADPTGQNWLEPLVAEYSGPLQGYFTRRLGHSAEVDDLVQEVFMRLSRMKGLEGVENPQAYIFQIASNLLKDRARRAGTRHDGAHEPFDEDNHHSGQLASPERMLLLREDLSALTAVLEKLPHRTRVTFILHRIEGLKYREIADALGISVSTVEKHMITAIAAITRKLGGPK
jgi:RNA polymerase sigma-70 factor (ECF subfamily)